MGPRNRKTAEFEDPELDFIEGSEIAAAVDVSIHGLDNVFRPFYINQDEQILNLTPEDAKRLYSFLGKALKFVEEYQARTLQ